MRTVGSLFGNLNQVYQTLLLRQIETNQTTVAQQEAFDRLSDRTDNVVNALDILGPANEQVKDALSGLIREADRLNSEQLTDLIRNYQDAGREANFTREEQDKFNETLQKLKDLLEETQLEEKRKEFDDFFGTLVTAGTAAGTLGTFAVNLAKLGPNIAGVATTLARFKPEIAIILVLLFGPEVAKQLGLLQTAGDSKLPSGNIFDDLQDNFQKLKEVAPGLGNGKDFFGRLGPPSNEAPPQININVDSMSLTNEADLFKWAEIVFNKIKEEQSRNVR